MIQNMMGKGWRERWFVRCRSRQLATPRLVGAAAVVAGVAVAAVGEAAVVAAAVAGEARVDRGGAHGGRSAVGTRRRHTSVYSAGSWGSSAERGGSWGSSGGSWGSSGGSVGVVTGAYVSPYIARPQTVVVARATISVSRPDARSALLTVSVPADARVYINGKATSSTGSFRQYASPNLSQGKTYTYRGSRGSQSGRSSGRAVRNGPAAGG